MIIVPMTPRMGTIKRSLAPLDPPKEELETDTQEKIRIAGRVYKPSMLEPIRGSNLLDLLISAHGTMPDADLAHIFLVKRLKDGKYRTRVVDLEGYIKNKIFRTSLMWELVRPSMYQKNKGLGFRNLAGIDGFS